MLHSSQSLLSNLIWATVISLSTYVGLILPSLSVVKIHVAEVDTELYNPLGSACGRIHQMLKQLKKRRLFVMKKRFFAVEMVMVFMICMLAGCGQRETASSKENNYTQNIMEQSSNVQR